jgi:hypothetical protein
MNCSYCHNPFDDDDTIVYWEGEDEPLHKACFDESIADLILDLTRRGLIDAHWDDEHMDFLYSISEEGKKHVEDFKQPDSLD